MPILDYISSLNLPSYSIHVVFAALFLIFIIWISSRISAYGNLYGKRLESEVEQEERLMPVRKILRGSLKLAIFLAKGGASLSNSLYARIRSNKKSSSPAETAAEGASLKVARASEEIEESAVALEAIEGRALGLIAALKLIEQSMENYALREQIEERIEEKEEESIGNLAVEITKISNYEQIDAAVLNYLKELLQELPSSLEKELQIKKGKENDMRKLILSLKKAINEMKPVLKEAKAEGGIFKKVERREWKNYSDSINKLKKAINEKYKELKKAKSSGKNADRGLIDNLNNEIELIGKQYNAANNLNAQLQITFEMMDKEIKESRRIIKKLLKYERQIKSVENIVNKTESSIGKKMRQIEDSFKKLEGTIKVFEADHDLHDVALSISGNLNNAIKDSEESGILSAEFNKTLKNILITGYGMVRLTETYEKIIEGLKQSQEAVVQGMEVLSKIMNSVITNPDVKIDEQEVANNLQRLNKLFDDQKGVDTYLKNLIASIKYKLNVLYSLIERISNEELKIAALMHRYSGYLGRMVGIAFNRKLKIDKDYMNQVETFQKNLKNYNETAYAAYSEARAA